jgi:UDPglucose 6-dehydrogenase
MGKNIAIVGSGYVGLTTGVCLSELGNKVICVDNDEDKVKRLRNYEIPIYEPGLEPLLKRNSLEGRLKFSADIIDATRKSDLIFLCVGTPPKENGETDLSAIENVVKDVAKASDNYKIIVQKSTVPVNTSVSLRETIKKHIKTEFDVAVNPEFLREGSAVYDFMHPDRIVIGTDSKRAFAELAELYKPLNAPILHTDINSAELIKHVSNAMLAQRISTINLIAELCEKTNADIETVAKGVGMDKRIGPYFLEAGIGYGGFCLPKDLDALVSMLEKKGINSSLFRSVREVNNYIRDYFGNRIIERFEREGGLKGKVVGVLGLSFKPDTDDMRLAPSIDIIKKLIANKVTIKVYDPKAMNNSKKIFRIDYCNDEYETAKDANALIIMTGWQKFKEMDLTKIKELMKKPIIFDGRNLYNKERMQSLGFEYYCIGK